MSNFQGVVSLWRGSHQLVHCIARGVEKVVQVTASARFVDLMHQMVDVVFHERRVLSIPVFLGALVLPVGRSD